MFYIYFKFELQFSRIFDLNMILLPPIYRREEDRKGFKMSSPRPLGLQR